MVLCGNKKHRRPICPDSACFSQRLLKALGVLNALVNVLTMTTNRSRLNTCPSAQHPLAFVPPIWIAQIPLRAQSQSLSINTAQSVAYPVQEVQLRTNLHSNERPSCTLHAAISTRSFQRFPKDASITGGTRPTQHHTKSGR